MSYYIKYKLSFVSDRDNDYELHILQKNYGGQPIVKKLGVAPTLSIEEGDGNIKGSSLSFSIQADVEGELRGLYTTDNKEFKVLLYRNSSLYWQGYLLPELYSEQYIDAPYDVSVTATDGLATLKAITYEREDVNVSIAAVVEDILSLTQLSLPLIYHMSIAHAFKKEYDEGGQLNPGGGLPIPMLTNTYISQAAYNGFTCYDVLNQILLSCNCCLMQIGGEWLVMSLTDSSENYYSAGANIQRKHKMLGQLGIAEVCPSGSLTLVNSPALKGANVEYSHMMRKSFFANPDCVDRRAWIYADDSRNPYDIPGEKESFGKIFKAHCFELHPNNISKDNTLQLWQEVALNKDDNNFYELAVKYLFGNNAKLLLLSITYYGDDGIARQLTSEGWVAEWDKKDVNSYIQITGQNKSASLDSISDIEQYEMAKVQFSLPGMGGTIRVGFINSTLNYADPLAYAPIYVTQVYLTVGGVSGQQCTTEVEPNATQEPQGVLLAYGDTFESANAYKLEINTLKRLSGENIASWWLNGRDYPSYYDAMLQEYSRYFGTKKVQLQGAIMGKNVLHSIYMDTHSGKAMRLVTAQVDLLSDEASVTLEEIVTADVEFTAVVYATNNTNSFGTPSSGGDGNVTGGSSSVDTSHLLGREEAANTYATKAVVEDLGHEVAEVREDLDALNNLLNDDVAGVINTWDEVVDFLNEYSESQDLASILSQMNADIANRVLYEDFEKLEDSVADIAGYFTEGSANNALKLGGHSADYYATADALAGVANTISAVEKRVTTLEDLGLVRVREGSTYYIKSIYSIVSEGEIISGRRASGSSSDVTGGGGISQVTAQMIVDALGYVPYSSLNPAGYITSSALNGYAKTSDIPSLKGYATETWVTNKGYITSAALDGYATQTWVEAKKYLTAIPSEYITETELSNTLGGYQTKITSSNKLAYSLISGTPSLATVATSGKYSDLSGTPSSLPASDVYDWAKAAIKPSYTASEVGALSTSGGTINGNLSINRSGYPYISYSNSNTFYGYLGFSDVGIPSMYDGTAWRDIIHSGNIGEQSVASAKALINASGVIGATIGDNGLSIHSGYIEYKDGDLFRLIGPQGSSKKLRYYDSTTWKDIAFTESNVASATKLQIARTIWGQSFDGSANVSGALYDTSGQEFIYSSGNLVRLGTGTAAKGCNTYIDGNNIYLRYGTTYKDGIALTSSGNVLIGTTTDNGNKLQVYQSNTANGDVALFESNATWNTLVLKLPSANGWSFGCNTNEEYYFYSHRNGKVVTITNTGNLIATGEVISTRRATSSDARLKDNINRLIAEDCLAMVRNLQPSSWDWKEDGKHSLGFIAQDVEQYMPYAVTRIKDDKLGEKLNLQYDQFIALAIGGVQAVDNEVQQLKKEVAELKQRLSKYETVWQ